MGVIVVAGALVAGGSSVGSAVDPPRLERHSCPTLPHGIIGDRWQNMMDPAKSGDRHRERIGCPVSPEAVPNHTPPGFPAGMAMANREKSRHQPFENGDIVWSPAQGAKMTVAVFPWDSGHIYVEWGDTGPYSYERFIVSVDGHQTDIHSSGRDGWKVVPASPGEHMVVVEGCDSDCKQGWTVPAVVAVPEPPKAPPKPNVPITQKPKITVSAKGDGSFVVTGEAFAPNSTVHIRDVDAQYRTLWFDQSADARGRLTFDTGKICAGYGAIHFSANDGRRSTTDLTGTLWSNTADTTCPA